MPNWCDNRLVITGHKKELDRFRLFAKGRGKTLDEDVFIPYPKRFKKLDNERAAWERKTKKIPKDQCETWVKNNPMPKDGYNQGGFAWCCKNWGSKWGFGSDITSRRPGPNVLVYRFQSAWSPPLPLILKAAQLFPTLTFSLRATDEGNFFDDLVTIVNSKIDSTIRGHIV